MSKAIYKELIQARKLKEMSDNMRHEKDGYWLCERLTLSNEAIDKYEKYIKKYKQVRKDDEQNIIKAVTKELKTTFNFRQDAIDMVTDVIKNYYEEIKNE